MEIEKWIEVSEALMHTTTFEMGIRIITVLITKWFDDSLMLS